MNLLDILDLDLIDLDMDATDKDGVLKQLSSMLYKKGNIKDLDKFLEAVYERESIGETGLGGIGVHSVPDAQGGMKIDFPATHFLQLGKRFFKGAGFSDLFSLAFCHLIRSDDDGTGILHSYGLCLQIGQS